MGKINSRAKGANGEREWRDQLLAHGIEARRGQQFSGLGDSPDVVADTPGWHPEVKRVEALNIEKAMEQAINDAKGKRPYVAHRKNKKPWLVTIKAEDWILQVLLQKALADTLGCPTDTPMEELLIKARQASKRV